MPKVASLQKNEVQACASNSQIKGISGYSCVHFKGNMIKLCDSEGAEVRQVSFC